MNLPAGFEGSDIQDLMERIALSAAVVLDRFGSARPRDYEWLGVAQELKALLPFIREDNRCQVEASLFWFQEALDKHPPNALGPQGNRSRKDR